MRGQCKNYWKDFLNNMNKQELYTLINNLTFKTDNYAIGFHLCGSLDVNKGIEKFNADWNNSVNK